MMTSVSGCVQGQQGYREMPTGRGQYLHHRVQSDDSLDRGVRIFVVELAHGEHHAREVHEKPEEERYELLDVPIAVVQARSDERAVRLSARDGDDYGQSEQISAQTLTSDDGNPTDDCELEAERQEVGENRRYGQERPRESHRPHEAVVRRDRGCSGLHRTGCQPVSEHADREPRR